MGGEDYSFQFTLVSSLTIALIVSLSIRLSLTSATLRKSSALTETP